MPDTILSTLHVFSFNPDNNHIAKDHYSPKIMAKEAEWSTESNYLRSHNK